MTEEQRRLDWLARRREARRLKRERTGDSPERAVQHHTPRGDVIDLMLNAGGVTRENRFKKDKS
ncbi:MAG: hypothetical protein ACXVH3_34500 [Solirubrobacteraceae bacterium]